MTAVQELIEQRGKLIALQAALPTTTYGILRAAGLAKHIEKTDQLIEIALQKKESAE